MTQFDLKASLKQISPALRQELFSSAWPVLRDLDWSQLAKKRSVDPLFEGIQALDPDDKREVSMLLRTCWGLRRPCGLKVIHEELTDQEPNLVAEWIEITSPMDKVVWTYLRAKHVLEEAIVFARADSLSTRRFWNKWTGVECGEFSASADRIDALKALLIDHHGEEGRGDVCEVHHYSRQNGAEYFSARGNSRNCWKQMQRLKRPNVLQRSLLLSMMRQLLDLSSMWMFRRRRNRGNEKLRSAIER